MQTNTRCHTTNFSNFFISYLGIENVIKFTYLLAYNCMCNNYSKHLLEFYSYCLPKPYLIESTILNIVVRPKEQNGGRQ